MACAVVYWLLVDTICGGGLFGEWPRDVPGRIGAPSDAAWPRPTSQTGPTRNPPIRHGAHGRPPPTARYTARRLRRLHRNASGQTSRLPRALCLVLWQCIIAMLPYQAVAMDYAVSSGFQRQTPIGLGVNINPAFTHSWFVPADLCVPYKQTPLLEPGHVTIILIIWSYAYCFHVFTRISSWSPTECNQVD